MLKVPYKTREEKIAEQTERERQRQIAQLESLLAERYQAHGKLLATDADPAEIEEVKDEIALILEELGGLYNATTT